MDQIQELHQLFLKNPHVCTDTRKIVKDGIFFALKGASFNGNEFAAQALEQGCAYAVIDEEKYAVNDRTILVSDVLSALQSLAKYHRKYWNKTIVALTGSNGKTTTKELIHAVLKQHYNVLATTGNLNNHIGVPLTLLQLRPEHKMAIVEMGANHQKEIELLCSIALPDYGLITNVGKAHLEGFGGEEGVLKGKGEMYDYIRSSKGKIFINSNDEKLNSIASGLSVITYGLSEKNNVYGKIIDDADFVKVELHIDDEVLLINSNLTGAYNLSNILCAAAVGKEFGVSADKIKKGIESYYPDNNRSQVVKTNKNTLILDAYNANPSSMVAALENLQRIKAENKYFILGEMREMGDYAKDEHLSILQKAVATGIKGAFVGMEFFALKDKFEPYLFFKNAEEAKHYFKKNTIEHSTILIKGSRGIKLEIVQPVF